VPGAIDELLASGALTDLTSNRDDIQAQLDKVAATSQVDDELAAMKTELAAAPPAGFPPECGRRYLGGPGASLLSHPARTVLRPHHQRERRIQVQPTRGNYLMAVSRRIPPDHELTFRMFLTGFFIVVLYAIVVGLLFAFLHNIGLIIFIAVALAFCQ